MDETAIEAETRARLLENARRLARAGLNLHRCGNAGAAEECEAAIEEMAQAELERYDITQERARVMARVLLDPAVKVFEAFGSVIEELSKAEVAIEGPPADREV